VGGPEVIALIAVLLGMVATGLRIRVRLHEAEVPPPRAVLFGVLDGMALALVCFWALGFLYLAVASVL
jgi:hypothetical protein